MLKIVLVCFLPSIWLFSNVFNFLLYRVFKYRKWEWEWDGSNVFAYFLGPISLVMTVIDLISSRKENE